MTSYLLYDAATRSPELRHEIGERVMDPVVFLEHGGKRVVVGSILEQPIFEKRADVVDEFWTVHELGADELVKDESFPFRLLGAEIVLRTVRRAGVTSVCVPGTFGILVADYLRDNGIEVTVDAESWELRRRVKTPWEIEGIERAQRAAEIAMLTAARMLREAEPSGPWQLRFEGEVLTAELIREAMQKELLTQGTECEEIIVQSGDACLSGHEVGSGPILPDQSCIIDCFPRDRITGTYSDMTRTFVPGEPSQDLAKLHEHRRTALRIAYESIRPGSKDAHDRVSDYFFEQAYPTYKHHERRDP